MAIGNIEQMEQARAEQIAQASESTEGVAFTAKGDEDITYHIRNACARLKRGSRIWSVTFQHCPWDLMHSREEDV